MQKIRFGLIGYGKVAHLHASALKNAEHIDLVAVCGRNKEKREDFAAQYSIKAFETIEQMSKSVDAVVITTPHPQHCEHAVSALEAGCHVLVEKPMSISVAECEKMIAASKKTGKLLSVISQRRFYPACLRIKEAIDSGRIGKPAIGQIIMLGWRDKEYYESDPWRGKWSTEGGGVLINQAPHQLDLLQWFMGEAVEVKSFWDNVNHPYVEIEDTAVAAIRFANGGMGSVLVSNSQKPGIFAKVHVHGTNAYSVGVQTDGGAMFIAGRSGVAEPPVNDLWTIPEEKELLQKWQEEDTALFAKIDGTRYFFKLQAEDFAKSLLKNKQPLVTAQEGLATVRLIELIYKNDKK